MGTHPIFESDFDCLTEKNEMNRLARPLVNVARRPLVTNQQLFKTQLIKPQMSMTKRNLGLAMITFPLLFISVDVATMFFVGELSGLFMTRYFQGMTCVSFMGVVIMEGSIALACLFKA